MRMLVLGSPACVRQVLVSSFISQEWVLILLFRLSNLKLVQLKEFNTTQYKSLYVVSYPLRDSQEIEDEFTLWEGFKALIEGQRERIGRTGSGS